MALGKTMLKLIYRINRWIGWSGLPIASVVTEGGASKCILRNDGWIVIRSTDRKDKSTDMLPITMVSEKLIKQFEAELG